MLRNEMIFMSIIVNIGSIIVGVILIYLIIRLMVNRKMTEAQSILWIIIGIVAIIIGLFPSIIIFIAKLLGVKYPAIIFFFIAYMALLIIVLKNTIIISVQSNQIRELVMNITLLNSEIEELKKIDKKEDDYS